MGLKTVDQRRLQKDFLAQGADTLDLTLHKPLQARLALQAV